MKKVNAPKSRQIWEPQDHPRKLKLPDKMKVFHPLAIQRPGIPVPKTRGGKFHCDSGPAVEFPGGDREWWLNGELHRDGDEPAIEIVDSGSKTMWPYPMSGFRAVQFFRLLPGAKVWAKDGYAHRDEGPTVNMPITAEERYLEYWREGRLHNATGPAVVSRSFEVYYYHGLPHRADGPAELLEDGAVQRRNWFWYGQLLVGMGEVVPSFPFNDPPVEYLLKALLDANFSDRLVEFLSLISKRVGALMPDFQQHIASCCDEISWALFQGHIRNALSAGAVQESYDYSFAL